jgi:hypothetical protein
MVSFVYSAAETKRISVLGACRCSIHRQQSVAYIRLRSVHGRISGASNEPFRLFRTPTYCTIHSSLWFDITLTGRVQIVANALNGVAMAVDITITISLCTLLSMTRTGFHPKCVPFSPLYVVSASFTLSSSTDRMLLRLIFISVNTGLSSTLFSFLSLILVRLDMLLGQPFPNSHHPPSGSSSCIRPISSTQPRISHSARCTATRFSRPSTCGRSSEVTVRHGN